MNVVPKIEEQIEDCMRKLGTGKYCFAVVPNFQVQIIDSLGTGRKIYVVVPKTMNKI